MTGNNNMDKKGFSGLSDLASEVSIDDPIKPEPEPKVEAKSSAPKQQPPQPQRKTATSKSERKTTGAPPSVETVNSGKSGGGSGGILTSDIYVILGIAGIIFLCWAVDQRDKSPAYYNTPASSQSSYPQSSSAPAIPNSPSPAQSDSPPQSSPTPAVISPSAGLQYTTPSVGTNNVLSTREIRWCIREEMRLGAIRNVNDTNTGIDEFNRLVNDYNSRCGSYRYRSGSLEQAKREVEQYRSQIVAEALRDARQVRRPPQQSSVLSASSSPSTNRASEQSLPSSVPEILSPQEIKEVQQLLKDFGYDPGPVDGAYGRRTADAVKALQQDIGAFQDGQITRTLLDALRKVKAEYKPPVAPQPKPQSQTVLQPRPSSPTSATIKPENLSYEEQSKYAAAQRLAQLGHNVDWRTSSLSNMHDAESRINAANRLARLGHNVNWQTSSLSNMHDAESRINAANRLARLGHNVNWQTSSLSNMHDAESRINAANRLARLG